MIKAIMIPFICVILAMISVNIIGLNLDEPYWLLVLLPWGIIALKWE